MENNKYLDSTLKIRNLHDACSHLMEGLCCLREALEPGDAARGMASDAYHEANDRLWDAWNEGLCLLAEEDPDQLDAESEEFCEFLRATFPGDWYNEDGGVKDMIRNLRKQLGL